VLTLVAIGLVGLIAIAIWWLIDAFLIPGITQQHNLQLIRRLGL
jgi:hypothetical protein